MPLTPLIKLDDAIKEELKKVTGGKEFSTTNEVFAHVLADKLSKEYAFTEEQMHAFLEDKPVHRINLIISWIMHISVLLYCLKAV